MIVSDYKIKGNGKPSFVPANQILKKVNAFLRFQHSIEEVMMSFEVHLLWSLTIKMTISFL